jgi:hypothetical protein
MDNLLAGIGFLLETIEKKTYQQIAQRTLHSEKIPGSCPFIPDVVHLFRSGEKVDNIAPESLDNFLRNRWTTSAGISGQLAPEYAPFAKGEFRNCKLWPFFHSSRGLRS